MNRIVFSLRIAGSRRHCVRTALYLAFLLWIPATQSQTGAIDETAQLPLQEQMRYLRQEIRRLQSDLEQSRELLNQLRQQQLNQYLELERRLLQVEAEREAAATPAADAARASPAQGQAEAYRKYQEARSLLQKGLHAQALAAFSEFLSRWPQGDYTADAWFWTGELYLQQRPPALEDARRAFAVVLANFPGHDREPNAMFKLGKVYHLQGKLEQAEQILRQLVQTYGDAAHSAARLAEGYLQQYF